MVCCRLVYVIFVLFGMFFWSIFFYFILLNYSQYLLCVVIREWVFKEKRYNKMYKIKNVVVSILICRYDILDEKLYF